MIKLTTKRTKWFVLPQDSDGETQVEILHLKPGVLAEIERKANRVVGRQVSDGFTTEVDIDLTKRAAEVLKACIVDWKGFQDENGKPMKCTKENILRVHGDFDWFFGQIEEFRAELAAEVEADEEGAEKN